MPLSIRPGRPPPRRPKEICHLVRLVCDRGSRNTLNLPFKSFVPPFIIYLLLNAQYMYLNTIYFCYSILLDDHPRGRTPVKETLNYFLSGQIGVKARNCNACDDGNAEASRRDMTLLCRRLFVPVIFQFLNGSCFIDMLVGKWGAFFFLCSSLSISRGLVPWGG